MKSGLKWKRASIIYPTDHIISSKAREVGIWGFKPQYEHAKHVNIRFILSNEYMRLWFKERDLYQKENYSKQEKARNEAQLRRGFVQRMMTNPKLQSRELRVIQMKRFQNIISKVDSGKTTEEKTKICERYEKTLEPVHLTRYKPACAVKPKTATDTKIDKKDTSKQKTSHKKKTPLDDDDDGSINLPGQCGGERKKKLSPLLDDELPTDLRAQCGLVCKVTEIDNKTQ